MKNVIILLNKNFEKNEKFWGAFFVFIIVFFSLGIPFTNWGFFTDDFGNIFHAQVKNIKDLFRFFYEGSAINFIMPSNYIPSEKECFSSICYRPLTFVYYYLQSLFFDFNAYGYYLVTIFFHALNTALLFYIFSYFTSLLMAFLLSCYFAFHPSLANWIGWTAAQQNHISLAFILLIILSFKTFLDSQKYRFYILSLVLFLLSLFTREITLVLPAVLVIGMYFYEKDVLSIQLKKRLHFVWYYIARQGPFFLTAFFYLLLRRWMFASDTSISALVFSKLLSLKSRGYQLVAFLTDLLGLNWLPWGQRYLKGTIFLIFFVALAWLFIRSTRKIYVIASLASAILFFWPAIIQTHDARFLYEALPFFLLSFLFLINSLYVNNFFIKRGVFLLFTCLIIFNASYLLFNLARREKGYHIIEQAFDDLVYNSNIGNKPLCFVGISGQLSPGFAQAIWLRDKSCKRKVYLDAKTKINSFGQLPWFDKMFRVKVKHYFDPNEQFEDDFLFISRTEKGVNIKCLDTDKLPLGYSNDDLPLSVGTVALNFIDENKKEIDLDLLLYDKYNTKDLIFVTWDYKNKKFIVIDNKI